MKVLLINNHHRQNGGAERYYFELAKLLARKGHDVAFFSMKAPKNVQTKWSKYFLSEVDFTKNGPKTLFKKIERTFYSFEAKTKIAKLLNDFKPDIVHIQNIYYYISPSILGEIKKRHIPIVQTVHDYELISPNLTLFSQGKICEITKRHKFYKALLHKSVKGSYIASGVAVIVSYLQYIFKFHERAINTFIAPSKFMKKKLREYGFQAKNVVVLPNFVILPKYTKITSKKGEGYVLYFGRLTTHKGLMILLEAAKKLPKIKFKIIGGYLDSNIKEEIQKIKHSKHINNIEFLDFQGGNKLKESIRRASFVVIPSLWYENQPYSILESYSYGKPVIASNIGGIPEIIKENETGLMFKPGDIDDFSKQVKKLWSNRNLIEKMGKSAYAYVKQNFNEDCYYSRLIGIYSQLIKK